LLEHLLHDPTMKRILVFTRTKHGANKVVRKLTRASVSAEPIHGNKSQSARERALANFKAGATRVLVATDIAARGIDVDDITHVINFDLPNEPETYVHRIGRTARAGASGIAFSFCNADERAYLVDIERLIRMHIPTALDYPHASELGPPPVTELTSRSRHNNQSKPQSRRSGRSRGPHTGRPNGSSNGSANGRGMGNRNHRRRQR
jgi:ATP-dependent RNA helicase RhlE